MPLVSLAQYGALHGVKKQAAWSWKKRGYLSTQGDLIDAEASDLRMKSLGKGRFNRGVKAIKRRAVNVPKTATVNAPETEAGPSVKDVWTRGYMSGLRDAGESFAFILGPELSFLGCSKEFIDRLRDRIRPKLIIKLNELGEEVGYVREPELDDEESYFVEADFSGAVNPPFG